MQEPELKDSSGTPVDCLPGSATFSVSVERHRGYPVIYEIGLLDRFGALFVEHFGDRRAIVLTDRRVGKLLGERLGASFAAVGRRPDVITIPEGEGSKSLETYSLLLDRLATLECDRRTVLVCCGGGVISDTGGFVASSYMRGIDYVNLPTTLLGQVDACVGGKVAVNARQAKNLFGAFHHPSLVVGDPGLLGTLSTRDFRSGLAEAVKVAFLAGPELFERLEACIEPIMARDPLVLTGLIAEAARLKMDMIASDPYEADLRRPLNFGHTIGHPIETEFQYRGIRHGESVAAGMGVATSVSLSRGLIEPSLAERVFDLLARFGLPGIDDELRPDRIIQHLRHVRLIRGCSLHFVLPVALGEVLITDEVDEAELVAGFEDYELRRREGAS